MESETFAPHRTLVLLFFIAINFFIWLENIFYHFITPYGRHHCCRRCENTSLLKIKSGVYGMNAIVPVFLTIAYISKPTRNCHNKNQLGWDHVTHTHTHMQAYLIHIYIYIQHGPILGDDKTTES